MSDILVANELLAFLQQKLDVMDEVSAIQICASHFSEDEIAAAKHLLFRVLNKSDQMVSRRRDGTKISVQDIITLLKETDPDDVPTFVAKDLHKLPPVTFDHIDVTCLLKDIVFLKASLADVQKKLDASQIIVADLRTELEEEYDASPLRRPAPAPAAPPHSAARTTRPINPKATASTPVAPPAKPMTKKSTVRAEEDDFVTVQRRKRRSRNIKNSCGKGPVDPNIKVRAAAPNTPVYISRLHYTTEAEDIVKYVCQKLKYAPRVQLLETPRNVNFKAFVVRIPNCFLHQVLEESFWPQDVVFRRFRGQVPVDRKKT